MISDVKACLRRIAATAIRLEMHQHEYYRIVKDRFVRQEWKETERIQRQWKKVVRARSELQAAVKAIRPAEPS